MMVALDLFCESLTKGSTVLHIGGGKTGEDKQLREAGFNLITADYSRNRVRYEAVPSRPLSYDGVYCSHTLEHVRNVGVFLDKIVSETKDGGLIGLVVPPLKQEIVGGHLSLWNAGLLVYNLIRAGLDCSQAAVHSYGYNCAVLVRKRKVGLPDLEEDCGDIESLRHLFPLPVEHGFDGRIQQCNWSVR